MIATIGFFSSGGRTTSRVHIKIILNLKKNMYRDSFLEDEDNRTAFLQETSSLETLYITDTIMAYSVFNSDNFHCTFRIIIIIVEQCE